MAEYGWLIEKPGSLLFWCASGCYEWGTANQATRFSRREDAEAMRLRLGFDDAIVTDHMWISKED